ESAPQDGAEPASAAIDEGAGGGDEPVREERPIEAVAEARPRGKERGPGADARSKPEEPEDLKAVAEAEDDEAEEDPFARLSTLRPFAAPAAAEWLPVDFAL